MPSSESYTASLSSPLSEIAVSERPQERLERQGPSALSDTELLAMLLRSGSKGMNVLAVASKLIADSGSLAGLVAWSDADFRNVKGIGKVKALQLVAVVEICRRVLAQRGDAQPILDSPDRVAAFMRPHLVGLEVERFWTLCLNRKNRLLRLCQVTSGTASNSLVHPREVFREAIRQGATAVICVHNHPSGDPSPSAADMKVTRQLRESANILNIAFHDHVIVGHTDQDPNSLGYYSFQDNGLI